MIDISEKYQCFNVKYINYSAIVCGMHELSYH